MAIPCHVMQGKINKRADIVEGFRFTMLNNELSDGSTKEPVLLNVQWRSGRCCESSCSAAIAMMLSFLPKR